MSHTESETPSKEHAGVGIILEKPPCRSGVGALNDVQHASPWTAAFLFSLAIFNVLSHSGIALKLENPKTESESTQSPNCDMEFRKLQKRRALVTLVTLFSQARDFWYYLTFSYH